MTTFSALTTLPGEDRAQALGEHMEQLDPAPTGIGVFEVEDGSGLWEVGGYFSERPDAAGLALLASIYGARHFTISRIDDRDWVAQVRRELHPVDAGRFTVHGGHDRERIAPNRIGLCIEAAMAFGTGHHGTTQGCLLLLERLIRRSVPVGSVADIGCGTGVLAMAAVRALHVPSVATDIDPVAAATARANARANSVGGGMVTGCAPGFRHPLLRERAPFDLVFANILAGPLKRLAPEIARHLAPGGHAILSGLLTPQAAGVEAVFRGHGLIRADRVRRGEWTSLLVRKSGRSGRLARSPFRCAQ